MENFVVIDVMIVKDEYFKFTRVLSICLARHPKGGNMYPRKPFHVPLI